MPDQKTTIGMDDRDFDRGAQRVGRKSRQMGKDVNKAFMAPTADKLVRKFATVDVAFQTVRRGLNMASQAASDFEAKNQALVASMGSGTKAVDRFRESLGQDLFFAFESTDSAMSRGIDMVDKWRTKLVNLTADLIHGKNAAQEFDESLGGQKNSLDETARINVFDGARLALAVEELKIEEGLARARNQNNASLLKMRRELLEIEERRKKRIQEINALDLDSARSKQLEAMANALIDSEANLVRTEHRQRAASELNAAAAERRRTEMARQRMDLDERSLAIRVRRLEGDKRGAEIEQARLDFARKRLELEEKGLAVAEKRRRLSVLNDLERRTIAALGQGGGPDGERRTAAIGVLGGRQVVAQQLGVNAQRTTASNTQRIAMLVDGLPPILRGILQAVASNPGAVYQP